MTRPTMGYDAPEVYARLIGPRYAEIAEALLKAARLKATDDVLEVGSGTGLLTAGAAPVVRSLVASDLSLPMLERARHALRGMPNVSYLKLDYGSPFPFLDKSFTVFLSGLTYLQDSGAALGEVARVLHPGGRLALSMWGASYQEKRLLDAALMSVAGQRFPGSKPGRVVRRLESQGFGSICRRDVSSSTLFASVADYIEYRRGFGKPTVWTTRLYERFLRTLHAQASTTAATDGSLHVGWTHVLMTATRQRN